MTKEGGKRNVISTKFHFSKYLCEYIRVVRSLRADPLTKAATESHEVLVKATLG